MTTTDEQGFLTAVRDNRADDTVRLVYADWLDERNEPGDAERAEFIRRDVRQSARAVSDPEWLAEEDWVYARVLALGESMASPLPVVRAYGRWVANGHGVDLECLHVCFRRGFVSEVRSPAADWLQHGDAICAAHPGLERVTLTTWPDIDVPNVEAEDWAMMGRDFARALLTRALEKRWPKLAFTLPELSSRSLNLESLVAAQLTNAMAANLDAQFNTPNIATPTLNVGEWTYDPNATISTEGFDDASPDMV